MSYVQKFLGDKDYSTCENIEQFKTWLVEEVRTHFFEFKGCYIMAFLNDTPDAQPCITGGINFKSMQEYSDYVMHKPGNIHFISVTNQRGGITIGFNTHKFYAKYHLLPLADSISSKEESFTDKTKKSEGPDLTWADFFKAIEKALIEKNKKVS
jgi:hypothetical protein